MSWDLPSKVVGEAVSQTVLPLFPPCPAPVFLLSSLPESLWCLRAQGDVGRVLPAKRPVPCTCLP